MVKAATLDPDLRDAFNGRKSTKKVTSVKKDSIKKMALPRNTDKFTLDNGLTPQQEAYARARAFGMGQQEAMYFATNGKITANGAGSHMEKKYPLVRKRINDLCAEVAERVVESAAVSKAWVTTRLMQVAERCMQAEPVLDREGERTGEYKFDSAGANRSLELLGKEMGMFTDRKHIKIENDIETLSDAELTRVTTELATQLGLAAAHAGTEETAGRQQTITLSPLR
jgi:phage terminase small subunit